MPLEKFKTHPYLLQGKNNGANKMILGSFPVYECTDPDNPIKQQNRNSECTIRFFYGIIDSSLWGLYRDKIDNEVLLPPRPEFILRSLAQRQIAI
jgi:hypothetical protein